MMPILPRKEEWLDQLSFLEQKGASTPLPAYTPHLIETMKTVQEEHLPWTLFVEGMLIVLAADPDFPYAESYLAWLREDKGLLPNLRARMNELTDSGHPLAFPYACALYVLEPHEEVSAALAFLYLMEEDPKNADYFAKQTTGDNPVALARLLVVYQRLGDEENTEKLLMRLIEVNAPGAELYQKQLRLLRQKKAEEKMEEALGQNDFHKAIDIVDGVEKRMRTGKMLYLRGTARQGLGLLEDSIEDMQLALEENYATPEVYNDLSIAYYLLGQSEKAIETLQEGIQNEGEDERLLYNLFVYAIQADRTDLALDALEKLRQMDINDPRIQADIQKIMSD